MYLLTYLFTYLLTYLVRVLAVLCVPLFQKIEAWCFCIILIALQSHGVVDSLSPENIGLPFTMQFFLPPCIGAREPASVKLIDLT